MLTTIKIVATIVAVSSLWIYAIVKKISLSVYLDYFYGLCLVFVLFFCLGNLYFFTGQLMSGFEKAPAWVYDYSYSKVEGRCGKLMIYFDGDWHTAGSTYSRANDVPLNFYEGKDSQIMVRVKRKGDRIRDVRRTAPVLGNIPALILFNMAWYLFGFVFEQGRKRKGMS